MEKVKKSPRKQAALESSPAFHTHPAQEELRAMGKRLREKCPRDSHAGWRPAKDRLDPIALMETANRGRIPHLIPVRHARMLKSPFTFFRGAAFDRPSSTLPSPTPTRASRITMS
jgi:hypothetical protein